MDGTKNVFFSLKPVLSISVKWSGFRMAALTVCCELFSDCSCLAEDRPTGVAKLYTALGHLGHARGHKQEAVWFSISGEYPRYAIVWSLNMTNLGQNMSSDHK